MYKMSMKLRVLEQKVDTAYVASKIEPLHSNIISGECRLVKHVST